MSTNNVSAAKVADVHKLPKRPRLASLIQPETEEQAAEQAVVPGPTGVVTRLSDVVPEHLRWLWPGRLPVGKLVVLDGDPGTGKSTIAVDWAARVSTGARWPDGGSCPKGDVLILSAEDGLADTVRPRLDAANGDPQRVHALEHIGETAIDGKVVERPVTLADVDTIRKAITDTGAKLMIVDVLMAYLPGKVDSHRDQDIRSVLSSIATMAEETGCTVLLLRHLNKANSGPALYRGGGSIGITGAARAAFVVATDPDDETSRVLACTKINIAAEPPSLTYRLQPAPNGDAARVEWGGESTYRADALLHRPDTTGHPERDEAEVWLEDYLTEQGRVKSSVVKAAARKEGFTERTLQRAAKQIGVIYVQEGFPRVTYWTLQGADDSDATAPGLPEQGATGGSGATGPDLRKRNAEPESDSQSRRSRHGMENPPELRARKKVFTPRKQKGRC